MNAFLKEIRAIVRPDQHSEHGPLPALLLGLTVVTGLVDAFSYLSLGHIFVANMTGNVVFLGFAFAGAPGFSVGSSLAAIASFGAGAMIGGTISTRLSHHRGNLLATAAAIQAIFLTIAVVLAALSGVPIASGYRYTLIVLVAVAMGIQSATGRKLAVPDLTTNVLTMTLTGMAADSVIGKGSGSGAGRRLLSVGTMLLGALVGAIFVIRGDIAVPLSLGVILTIAVAVSTWRLGASNPTWVTTKAQRESTKAAVEGNPAH